MAEDLHDVRLNHRVAELDWEGDTVSVKCADGSEIQADYVIVTVSLGVLKVLTNLLCVLLHLYPHSGVMRLNFGPKITDLQNMCYYISS